MRNTTYLNEPFDHKVFRLDMLEINAHENHTKLQRVEAVQLEI